ncbi:MAG: hypothetical protein R3B67_04635 [Phycisphaerales bacterium]
MNEAGQHKVMVVTGTRAEFGLLKPVMHAIPCTWLGTGSMSSRPARTWCSRR